MNFFSIINTIRPGNSLDSFDGIDKPTDDQKQTIN